jgi:Anp1
MQTGSLISRQRQNLAMSAIDSGASHILWLDSDMMYPVTVAETLLQHRQDVVACNYSTRTEPIKGVAYKRIGDWDSWLKPGNTTPRLQEAAGVGMGCMLTSTQVYEKLEKPWFEVSWVDEYNDFIGEDFYFCVLAREAGYKVMIDSVLSQQIKHIGIAEFCLDTTQTGWQ